MDRLEGGVGRRGEGEELRKEREGREERREGKEGRGEGEEKRDPMLGWSKDTALLTENYQRNQIIGGIFSGR